MKVQTKLNILILVVSVLGSLVSMLVVKNFRLQEQVSEKPKISEKSEKPSAPEKQTVLRHTPVIVRQERAPVPQTPAPIRTYNPDVVQQLGVIVSGNNARPLYGRRKPYKRNRYEYYTMTPGLNPYPVPVHHNNRNCMEDFGCDEFFGDESVEVTGSNDIYNVELYSMRQF